jgi:hypothetical protein
MTHPQPPGRRHSLLGLLFLTLGLCFTTPARGGDIEAPPIQYSTAPADNPVSRLQRRLDAGECSLSYDKRFGYLLALLRELHVPRSSQMLVFSKTSFQRHRIAPRTPRAVYFSDEAYVGFCRHGDVLEVSAVDPQLGVVFYTLDQAPADKPQFVRQNDNCMICHGSSQNEGLPGHLVRSLYVDGDGLPILAAGSHRVDHTTPLEHRWGGWYVTGTSGKQNHMGNLIVRDKRASGQIDNPLGRNVADLGHFLDTSAYLTPHSDIVALLTMEHQTGAQNLITRANFLTRWALRDEAEINKALGRPADYHSESTASRIKNAGEPLVKYLLFSGEAPLTEPVCGTSGFAAEFVQRGPRDGQGRSLCDFDLRRRLFAYPCSYVIYSAAFDGLPVPVKDYVYRRLWEVLTGKDTSDDFAHLSPADRRAILEILRATKPGLPDYWKAES